MVINLGSLIASLTWAPVAALLLGAATVIWYARRVPRQLWIAAAAMVVALIILWPSVNERIVSQQISQGNIQTLDFRFLNWQVFFLPALAEHLWFGSGAILPGDLPPYLYDFVDNEFLRMGFRAGLAGIGLLIGMLTVVGWSGWSCRLSSLTRPERRELFRSIDFLPCRVRRAARRRSPRCVHNGETSGERAHPSLR